MTETTQPRQQQQQEERPERRFCDYCNDRTAVLYCRADSAKLCFSCDKEVHSTNKLFSKHSRSLLCDVCDASPASIFCETEQFVLCTNCDWENHCKGNLCISSVHNRRPILSFTGCPSVSEMFTIVGFDDWDHKALFLTDENCNDSRISDGLWDLLPWESTDFVSIDDLVGCTESDHNFQALSVPPLPKNRKAACGQRKEEMLCQLRQLAKLEPNFKYENPDVAIVGFRSLVPEPNFQLGNLHTGSECDAESISFPAYETSALQWLNYSCETANQLPSTLLRNIVEDSFTVPDKHLDTGGCVRNIIDGDEGQSQRSNVNAQISSVFPKGSAHELNSQERDSAISRYKEKRKTRRYDKHIRYESRKVQAESRTRMKGRFARINL